MHYWVYKGSSSFLKRQSRMTCKWITLLFMYLNGVTPIVLEQDALDEDPIAINLHMILTHTLDKERFGHKMRSITLWNL